MKKTIKEKLVQHMIENGNDFTYTEMIKEVLRISKGHNYKYDHNSPDRGYYTTNFSKRWNGYMVNGKVLVEYIKMKITGTVLPIIKNK